MFFGVAEVALTVFSCMLVLVTVNEVQVNKNAERVLFIALSITHLLFGLAALDFYDTWLLGQCLATLQIAVAVIALFGNTLGLIRQYRSTVSDTATQTS